MTVGKIGMAVFISGLPVRTAVSQTQRFMAIQFTRHIQRIAVRLPLIAQAMGFVTSASITIVSIPMGKQIVSAARRIEMSYSKTTLFNGLSVRFFLAKKPFGCQSLVKEDCCSSNRKGNRHKVLTENRKLFLTVA